MESYDESGFIFTFCMVLVGVALVFLAWLPISMIINWEENKAEHAASFECEKVGGKYGWIDSNREGKACMKEYTSCGPDENKPGFTVCEQKFKRID